MGINHAWYRREGLALLTDFYELTMIAGQRKEGRVDQEAVFNYFFRSLPPHAGFAVVAGIEQFIQYLENLRFQQDDLDYLASLGTFEADFIKFLRTFRPTCSIQAVPEGTLAFPHEPVIQAQGSLIQLQLIETALLNMVNYQTLIATKAARICLAAEGDPVLEFGLRRAHGPDGGLSGSRAAHIGGCSSTSNVLAGKVYGLPVAGTHAHSWVMSFPNELEAFRAFARSYPKNCILLVDTYDTVESGLPNAIRVFEEMRAEGQDVRAAIRLDSGDLAKLSKIAHRMMTEAGFDNPLIVASNDLDEDIMADLKRQGAKVNAWGVGTHLITSWDSPAMSGVYKLVALREEGKWQPRMKISSNIEKATDPGRKRLARYFGADGQPVGDVIYEADEVPLKPGAAVIGRSRSRPHLRRRIRDTTRTEDLFETIFEKGRRVGDPEPIAAIRQRALDQIARLPDEFKRLRNPEVYRVMLSERIGGWKETMIENPDMA